MARIPVEVLEKIKNARGMVLGPGDVATADDDDWRSGIVTIRWDRGIFLDVPVRALKPLSPVRRS